MLLKLLKEIANANSYSISKFAKKFNTTELMIKEMINRLIKLGYMEKVENEGCNCGNIGSKVCACCVNKQISINMIKITQKGLNVLTK